MKIDSQSHEIVVPVGGHEFGTRFDIESEHEIGGEGVSVSWWPDTAFLCEWKWGDGSRSRSVLMLPQKRTECWLDDLVRSKEKGLCVLVGIIPVADIKLPAYVVPTKYREDQQQYFADSEDE